MIAAIEQRTWQNLGHRTLHLRTRDQNTPVLPAHFVILAQAAPTSKSRFMHPRTPSLFCMHCQRHSLHCSGPALRAVLERAVSKLASQRVACQIARLRRFQKAHGPVHLFCQPLIQAPVLTRALFNHTDLIVQRRGSGAQWARMHGRDRR